MNKSELMKKLNLVTADDLSGYEAGETDDESEVEMFQRLINSGAAWQLQGSYGRRAMDLIESGDCVLGEQGFRDYWGNYVPSRYEVKAGTKGSLEYQQQILENR